MTLDLYVDPETGRRISTHSMLKTFRRCPKQVDYKYVQRLKPRTVGKPLKRGVWIHKLLQVKYEGGDWLAEHMRLSSKFERLFDEERDYYGDLPTEILLVMKAYEWHYAKADWPTVHAVEEVIEVELPDGSIYRCKVDVIVEDQFGVHIVDHKSHKTLPKLGYRLKDSQSADYVWAANKAGIPARSHIWNYLRWKAPSVPQLVYVGKPSQRLSKRECDTDYPTLVRTVREYARDNGLVITDEVKAWAAHLKSTRYQHGELQQSTFFRRDVLERKPGMLSQVAREMYHTHQRMHSYPWHRPKIIERVPDRSCDFSCDYAALCELELWGGEAKQLRRTRYKEADPMAYYFDEKEVADGTEGQA